MWQLPVDVVDGERFGEENEREDNTDDFSECGHRDGKESSKLAYQAKNNLEMEYYLLPKKVPD